MSGAEIAVFKGHEDHEDTVHSAAFSPDGGRVVTASFDRTARTWDATSGAEIAVLEGAGYYSAAFVPDGRRVLSASFGGKVRLWLVAADQDAIDYAIRLLPVQCRPAGIPFATIPSAGRPVFDGPRTLLAARGLG